MSVSTWLAFALGAGLGAPLRFLIDAAIERRHESVRPRGTLVVNGAGSLLVGVVTALTLRDHISSDAGIIVGVGFCGALTTFSTFAVETVRLIEEGAVEEALRNVALHASVAIGLAAAGYAVVLNLF